MRQVYISVLFVTLVRCASPQSVVDVSAEDSHDSTSDAAAPDQGRHPDMDLPQYNLPGLLRHPGHLPGEAVVDPWAYPHQFVVGPASRLKGMAIPEPDRPTAVIECLEGQEVPPQTVIHLIGSNSIPANGAIKKWEWSVEQPLLSSSVFVPSYNYPDPMFKVNLFGVYTFRLTVTDSYGAKSAPATVEVVTGCYPDLHVELSWDTGVPEDNSQGRDLDLHLAHSNASQPDIDLDGSPDPWFDPLWDCFYFNPSPTWVESFDDNWNPELSRPMLSGLGYEYVYLNRPQEGQSYSVGVHYWNDNLLGATTAKVRFYVFGFMLYEGQASLSKDDLWEVGKFQYDSATFMPSTNPSGGPKITPDYHNTEFEASIGIFPEE